MSFMITVTGREHHLDGQQQRHNCPTIEEIAHSLAQINRFTGHALRPYSVAEHSLLVCSMASDAGAPPEVQLAALLHDAHEAFVGDVSSPVKSAIGSTWSKLEFRHAWQTSKALGLRALILENEHAIKRWDLIALATERRDLTAYDHTRNNPWAILDTPGHEVAPLDLRLDTTTRGSITWLQWRDLFLQTHNSLLQRINPMAP